MPESPSLSSSASPSASPSIGEYEIVYDVSQWRGVYLVKWETLRTGGNVGEPYACPNYPIKSVQVIGTFGGATCTIQGSNIVESPTYATLTEDGTDGLAITSAGIKNIFENTYWIRPNITGGDATTDLDVYLLYVTER